MHIRFLVLLLFFLGRGCETRNEGDESFSETITIPKMKWTETPSVIPKGKRKVTTCLPMFRV